MKLAENTVEVQSNMQFDEVHKVTIADDDEAVSMVIERLISAYDNPYRAALREYTSNAYDEHIASGQTKPVEVSLPSDLSPVLKVQDFGRGLTREELKGFGTIGKSTKRNSNEFTGGFGMGSKCALAAAPQFTVVSVKNGLRNTVIVARDENNIPHMNFLAETETSDETGTTIIIPISDVKKFGNLDNFWLGWKPGSILVDDEAPTATIYNPDHYREMKNGYGWYDLRNVSSGRDMIRVLINQVYYELPYQKLGVDYKQWNILKYTIVKIDNGSVDIAPSRETLLFNARTKAAVDERMNAILSIAAREQAKSVYDAPDIKTALTLIEKMKNNGFPTADVKWQGRGIALPGMVIKGNVVPDQMGTWCNPHRDSNRTGYRVDKNWRGLSGNRVWMNSDQVRFVIVHSAGAATTYGKYGRRMAHREAHGVGEWLSQQDNARQFNWEVFITSEPLNRINRHYRDMADVILHADEFNAVVKSVRAEAAKYAKEERDAKKASRKMTVIPPTYRSPQEYTVGDIAQGFKYVVFLRNQDGGMGGRFRDSMTTKVNENRTWNNTFDMLRRKYNAVVILINKNDKIDELKTVLPKAVTFQELAIMAIRESYQSATKYDLMAIRDRQDDSVDVFKYLKDEHLEKIKNRETVKWAKAVRDFRDQGAAMRSNFEWMSHYDQNVKAALSAGRLDTSKPLPESPIKRYPLLRAVYGHSAKPNDVIQYINLMEQALKKG